MYRYQSTTKLIETQSSAMAAAGIKGVKPAVMSYWAYWIRIAFSLTIEAQSADGGWIPIPKKLRLDIVKIIKHIKEKTGKEVDENLAISLLQKRLKNL